MADKVKLTPPMTDSKTPDWAVEAAIDAINYTGVCTLSGLDFDDVVEKVTQALLSAYERGRAERAWRPIETAPKDGTFFDVWYARNDAPRPTPAHRVTDVFWDSEEEALCVYGNWGSDEPNPLPLYPLPTHWMPLPAPPAKENANER